MKYNFKLDQTLKTLAQEHAIYEAEKMYNTIDCCKPASVPVPKLCNESVPKKKQQEKKMYDLYEAEMTPTITTPDERKANFLACQLDNAVCRKRGELYVAFKMEGTPPPKSPKEFVDYIKAGKFEFAKNYLNDDGSWRDETKTPYWYSNRFMDYVSWNDPEKAADFAGYEAAVDKVEADQKEVMRTITIGTPAEGLAALKDFESKTFH